MEEETPENTATNRALSKAETRAVAPDRRRHDRSEFIARVIVHELDGDHTPGKGHPAESVDISRSGIGVRSKKMYYQGTLVVLIIQLKSERRVKCGVVRSSRYAGGGQYQSGIEFTHPPSGAGLEAWLVAHPESA